MNPKSFKEFVERFTTRLFLSAELDGCILMTQVNEVSLFLERFTNNVHSKSTAPYGSIRRSMRRVPKGKKYVIPILSRNSNLAYSSIINYYQFEATDRDKCQKLVIELPMHFNAKK